MKSIELISGTNDVGYSVCDEFGQCVICNEIINKKNQIIANDIINDHRKSQIVRSIEIELFPSIKTKKYFSIDGVNGLIRKFLQPKNNEIISEMRELEVVLNIYFLENIIRIELFFLGEIKQITLDWFQKVSSKLGLEGKNGDIELKHYEFPDGLQGQEYLFEIPNYFGKELFIEDQELKRIGLSEKHLFELDILRAVGIKRFRCKNFLDDKSHSIFHLEKSENSRAKIQKHSMKTCPNLSKFIYTSAFLSLGKNIKKFVEKYPQYDI